jgi:hypothetical protein
VGQSYLITNAPSQTSAGWGNIFAQVNDIIAFNGTVWEVIWSAANHSFANQQGTLEYVQNMFTGKLLEWNGEQWSEYILPRYAPGYWRLAL